MKKEIIINTDCTYLSSYDRHTPDDLIKIAKRMKNDGVSSFEICDDYGSIGFRYFRLESEEETAKRIKKEAINKENQTRHREGYLLREAEALGYKLEKK